MNFLAHLHLADPGRLAPPLVLVGNLMPDLVRGRLPADLPDPVLAGIARHRRVDLWTDTHPAFAATRDRLKPALGRFAGIAADVLYDHCLSRGWAEFHPTPLPNFIAGSYAALSAPEARPVMPPRMAAAVELMIAQHWLGRYATDKGLRATFAQMSARFAQRFGRPVDLTPAVDALAAHRAAIETDFTALFADLVRRCSEPDG